jgi:hypothetical protein
VSLGVDCTAERKALHVWLLPEITKIMEESGVEFDLFDPYFCCPDNFCCDSLFRELSLWEMQNCKLWTTVGVHAIVLLNSKYAPSPLTTTPLFVLNMSLNRYGALMVPPSLSKDQIAVLDGQAQDAPVAPPAPPSSRPALLTQAQSARLIRSWYSAPLPHSPEPFTLASTATRYPIYGTLDLDQKAAMISWAAAELQLASAFEVCGITCPSLLDRLVSLALSSTAAAEVPKHAGVCAVKRLLRCLTPQDPSAPSYLNVERGSSAVQSDLEERLRRLVARTEAAIAPGMQKRHTVVWSDVGITSSTHSEYLRDLASDVYSLIVDAVSSSIDTRPSVPPIVVEALTQSQFAAQAAALPYIPGPPLHQLLEYLLDHGQHHKPSAKAASRRARAVIGPSGSGRNACVATALSLITRHISWSSFEQLEIPPPFDSSPVSLNDVVIIYRSVALTMGPRTPRALLLSVIQQICAAYAAKLPDPDSPFMALVNDFVSYLSMASAQRPLVVALVGIDDLYAIDLFSIALLVPVELPPYVKFVVSLRAIEEEMSELHDYMFNPPEARLSKSGAIIIKPMPAEQQQSLLRAHLKAAGVAVSTAQMIELKEALQEVPTPLYGYLIASCSAIRGSSAPVIRFSRSVTSVVDSFFERLPSYGLSDRCELFKTQNPFSFARNMTALAGS